MKYLTIITLYILGWLLAKVIIKAIDKIAEIRIKGHLKRIYKLKNH